MLTVTEIAKEKLREDLQKKTTDPEKVIRLVNSPSEPNRLLLVLDKVRERSSRGKQRGYKGIADRSLFSL
jgi:hypothetical protein